MLNDKRMTEERRREIEQLAALIRRHGIEAALRELVRRQKERKRA